MIVSMAVVKLGSDEAATFDLWFHIKSIDILGWILLKGKKNIQSRHKIKIRSLKTSDSFE